MPYLLYHKEALRNGTKTALWYCRSLDGIYWHWNSKKAKAHRFSKDEAYQTAASLNRYRMDKDVQVEQTIERERLRERL